MNQNKRSGFSLLETLLYLGIFAIIGGALFGILANVIRISTTEVSGDEIASQLNFAMTTINRLVRESSNIEMATSTATTTLKLRMANSALDPTCIMLSGGALKLAQGPDPFQEQNCSATTTDLTTNKVVVDSVSFQKLEFPGGHDQVQVNLQLSNLATGASKISRALRSGVSRASAATFDSDLLPNNDATYEVGSIISGGKRWKNAGFSGTVTVAGNIGIGTLTVGDKLTITGPYAANQNYGVGINNGMSGASLYSVGLKLRSDAVGNFRGAFDLTTAGTNTEPISLYGNNVGIGVTAPTYRLHLGVDSAAKPTSNVWTIASDERLKTNINDFTDGLSTLLNIRPRTYQYNGRGGVGYDDSGVHIGVIAQELKSIAPYMVGTFRGVLDGQITELENYDGQALPFIIVNAIKEQQKQIERQKGEIAELRVEIENLKK